MHDCFTLPSPITALYSRWFAIPREDRWSSHPSLLMLRPWSQPCFCGCFCYSVRPSSDPLTKLSPSTSTTLLRGRNWPLLCECDAHWKTDRMCWGMPFFVAAPLTCLSLFGWLCSHLPTALKYAWILLDSASSSRFGWRVRVRKVCVHTNQRN